MFYNNVERKIILLFTCMAQIHKFKVTSLEFIMGLVPDHILKKKWELVEGRTFIQEI